MIRLLFCLIGLLFLYAWWDNLRILIVILPLLFLSLCLVTVDGIQLKKERIIITRYHFFGFFADKYSLRKEKVKLSTKREQAYDEVFEDDHSYGLIALLFFGLKGLFIDTEAGAIVFSYEAGMEKKVWLNDDEYKRIDSMLHR